MRTTVRVSFAYSVLMAATGCHTFDTPAPVRLRVLDAETRSPVPGAAIRLSPLLGSGEATATAGKDGVAVLAVKQDEPAGWSASVSAAGYIADAVEVASASERAVTPTAEVALFAGPSPTLLLTIPDKYRGAVVVTTKVDPAAKPARAFTGTASATGDVTVTGPPVLKWLLASGVTAHRSNGQPMPMKGAATDTLFQWVHTSGPTITFFVGTAAERDAFRKTLEPPPPTRAAPTANGGGKHGGRGGGRHGGGGRGGMGGGM